MRDLILKKKPNRKEIFMRTHNSHTPNWAVRIVHVQSWWLQPKKDIQRKEDANVTTSKFMCDFYPGYLKYHKNKERDAEKTKNRDFYLSRSSFCSVSLQINRIVMDESILVTFVDLRFLFSSVISTWIDFWRNNDNDTVIEQIVNGM